jgi:acetyl-CoA carboxylase carboxyl transferase subunit beta
VAGALARPHLAGSRWRFEGYPGRIEAFRKKAGRSDAIYTGAAKLDGLVLHLGVMNFAFMGGSMGSVVGEKIARLAQRSIDKRAPLVIVCTSGGAGCRSASSP